jgi:hypothetical protein
VKPTVPLPHPARVAPGSELWLGKDWLGANAVPLVMAALFVMLSGAYLEWLVALMAQVDFEGVGFGPDACRRRLGLGRALSWARCFGRCQRARAARGGSKAAGRFLGPPVTARAFCRP